MTTSDSTSDNIYKIWRDTPEPVHTVGTCKLWHYCQQADVDLGNGYCVKCWDRGYGGSKQAYDYAK